MYAYSRYPLISYASLIPSRSLDLHQGLRHDEKGPFRSATSNFGLDALKEVSGPSTSALLQHQAAHHIGSLQPLFAQFHRQTTTNPFLPSANHS